MRTPDATVDSLALPDVPKNWTGVKTFVEIVRGPRFDAVRGEMRIRDPNAFAELEAAQSGLLAAAAAHRLTEPLDDGAVPMMERILQIIDAAASAEGMPEVDASSAVVDVTIGDRRVAAMEALADSPGATVTA